MLIAALVVVASFVGPPPPPDYAAPVPPQPIVSVAKPAAIYLGLGAVDLAMTEWALSRNTGGREGNPLLGHPAVRVSVVSGVAIGFHLWDVRDQRRGGDPQERRKLRIIYGVIKGAAIAWTASEIARGR